MISILIKIALLFGAHASSFSDLSKDLVFNDIFSYLTKLDVIKSISGLNVRTRRDYFFGKHKKEIDTIKAIEYLFDSGGFSLNAIRQMASEVQLSEFYALKLPSLLEVIRKKYQFADCILKAMNIQTMSYPELRVMQFGEAVPASIQFKLKMLVLASRNLAPLSSTNYEQLYPWKYPGLADVPSVDHIYFSHLYQHLLTVCHKELNLPYLDSLYQTSDNVQRTNLLYLIENRGFIPWHKAALSKQREYSHPFDYHHIIEINKINNLFFGDQKYKDFSNDVLTQIFVNEFANTTTSEINPGHFPKQMTAITIIQKLAKYNFNAHNQIYFDKLLRILSKMFNVEMGIDTLLEPDILFDLLFMNHCF